ncbi:MAG: hypothetical protein ACE5G8_01830 [Anaerolineae bacterium]
MQRVNHTLIIRIIPRRLWLALGPGWAVLGGVLASGGLRFEANFWALNGALLVKAALLWLLADPVLGTLWHLMVERGAWRRLYRGMYLERPGVKPLFPYTTRYSMGYRLSALAAALRAHNDGLWQTFLLLAVMALVLAALLGRPVMLYAGVSILLAVWAGRPQRVPASAGPQFWQSVATFLLPYLAALNLAGGVPRAGLLVGVCYWVVYLGSLRLAAGRNSGARPVIVGQAVAAGLLFALVEPVAATAVSLAAVFGLMRYLQAGPNRAVGWADSIHPFLLSGLLIAAFLLGAAA